MRLVGKFENADPLLSSNPRHDVKLTYSISMIITRSQSAIEGIPAADITVSSQQLIAVAHLTIES